MPRKNAARPTDRTNTVAKSSEDAPAAVHQKVVPGPESKPAASRIYEATRVSGKSHTVQGDVFNTHNHFYGDKLAWCDSGTPSVADTGGVSGLYIASKFHGLAPESISRYDAQREIWLRSASRLSNTCQWIFENAEYKNWQSGCGPPILIWTGPVGCGKSIAASAVIERLDADQLDKHVLVLSYFVDASRTERVTAREMLLALIKQMMLTHHATRGQLPQEVQQSIGTCLWESDDILTLATLTQIAIDLVQQQGACTFVIDGIDAMEEPEILAFIRFLSKIFEKSDKSSLGCKLMLFCRETLGRGIRLQNVPQACIFVTEAIHVRRDIRLYVDHEVNTKQLERSISTDDALTDRVRTVLKENAERMFLWVRLQILTIWDPNYTTCDQDIEDQLRELPKGLDDIYIRCLNRIEISNGGLSEDIAPKVFKWVASAKEPLTQLQAREAVSLTCRNLPIQRSKVLSSPVTDYCANLVTLNHLTGTVTFPHPTVKDFLCDLSKLPAHLHKYHISPEADDLWLGEICLAYAKILPTSRSLTQHRKPKFDSRVPSGILQNTLTTSLPFRWPRKRSTPSKTNIEVPVAPKSTQGLLRSDFSLHEYMCKYWLEHNHRIRPNNPAYKMFTEICLGRDADLQPWTKGYGSEVERYQQTVQHAVMTDHGPLIQVVSEYLRPFDSLRGQVFLRPCPGTDSSFLHVAAALGHMYVLPVLSQHCGKTLANSRGQSPAAVAAENFQQAAFEWLRGGFSNLTWELVHQVGGTTVKECLLHVCAASGNIDAVEYILANTDLDKGTNRETLAEAFFLACFRGHSIVASRFVSCGVDPNFFHFEHLSPEIHKFIGPDVWDALGPCAVPGDSSLSLALRMKMPMFMSNLLASGASFSSRSEHCDIIDVIGCYNIENIHERGEAAQFIDILARNGALLNMAHRSGGLHWPELMLQSIYNWMPWRAHIRQWSQYMRLIMQIFGHHGNSDFDCNLQNQLPSQLYNDKTIGILLGAPDDVLIRMLGYGWFRETFLLTADSIRALLRRGTSRLLEALVDHLGISNILMYQACGLTNSCLTLADLLGYRSCQKYRCRQAWQNQNDCLPSHLRKEMKTVSDAAKCIQEEMFHWRNCLAGSSSAVFDTLLADFVLGVRDTARHQILDFLRCYGHFHCNSSRDPEWLKYTPLEQIYYHEAEFANAEPRPLPLTWHRCMVKAKHDTAKARQIYTDLVQNRSQANFALNWPAGYFIPQTSFDIGEQLIRPGPSIAGVKLSIIMALYGWSFRLNRSKGKAFSSADVWFIGVRLMLGIRDRPRLLPSSLTRHRNASMEALAGRRI